MDNFGKKILPFLVRGIAIALVIGLIFVLSWLVIWGVFIGGCLFFLTWIKRQLFPKSVPSPEASSQVQEKSAQFEGRILDHDEFKH